MKKKRRRIKLILLLLAMALASVALLGFSLLKRTPDYYVMMVLSPEQQEAAAQRAEDTITRMQNLAAAARGAEIRASTNPTARVTREGTTFSFTQDELNALFAKWSEKFKWRDSYGQYLTDPVIILQSNRMILAGRVKVRDIDSIVSFHFVPKIDEKNLLDLNLIAVRGGNLPLPENFLMSPLRAHLKRKLEPRVPVWQAAAKLDQHGGVNDDMMKLAMARLVVNVLQEQPAENVIFLPVFQENRRVPAFLSDVKVTEGEMQFTVFPMNATQRNDLLTHLKEPIDFAKLDQ